MLRRSTSSLRLYSLFNIGEGASNAPIKLFLQKLCKWLLDPRFAKQVKLTQWATWTPEEPVLTQTSTKVVWAAEVSLPGTASANPVHSAGLPGSIHSPQLALFTSGTLVWAKSLSVFFFFMGK